jgi:uncharacterized OsmC-like protein
LTSLVASYDVRIALADPSCDGADPEDLVVVHHLAGRARICAEVLSGGHLLHLAVAGCLFNDIVREAGSRGIAVTDLVVQARGGFGGEPTTSTGITYSVELAGDAPEEELRRLVADCEQVAAIPHTLRRGTQVQADAVMVRGTAEPDA